MLIQYRYMFMILCDFVRCLRYWWCEIKSASKKMCSLHWSASWTTVACHREILYTQSNKSGQSCKSISQTADHATSHSHLLTRPFPSSFIRPASRNHQFINQPKPSVKETDQSAQPGHFDSLIDKNNHHWYDQLHEENQFSRSGFTCTCILRVLRNRADKINLKQIKTKVRL